MTGGGHVKRTFSANRSTEARNGFREEEGRPNLTPQKLLTDVQYIDRKPYLG